MLAKEVEDGWEKLKTQVKAWDVPGIVSRIKQSLLEPCTM